MNYEKVDNENPTPTMAPFTMRWIATAVGIVVVMAIVILSIYIVWSSSSSSPSSWKPTVLIISFDGFRNRFLTEKSPSLYPNLKKLMDTGLYSQSLVPSFPTLTFPNHYAIVTGLYPSWNGIVANTMYDPVLNATFSLGNTESYNSAWWFGEPLWVSALKNGQLSGTMFWPGSDVEIDGYYPTYYYKYDGSVSFKDRCDVIIEWLSYPSDLRPTFLTLYFDEPDHTEHTYGPDDPHVDAAIEEVDYYLGYLLDQLESLNIRQHVDVIVVSDHGMTYTPPELNIYLDDYNVTVATVSQMYNPKYQNVDGWVVSWTPLCTIIPAPGRADTLLTNLANAPNLTVYTNDTIALNSNWSYCCSDRITQVVLVADIGCTITTRSRYNPSQQLLGGHGYDNMHRDMQAIFVANGPHFQHKATPTAPLQNINVYSMVCEILKMECPASNATMSLNDIKKEYLK